MELLVLVLVVLQLVEVETELLADQAGLEGRAELQLLHVFPLEETRHLQQELSPPGLRH